MGEEDPAKKLKEQSEGKIRRMDKDLIKVRASRRKFIKIPGTIQKLIRLAGLWAEPCRTGLFELHGLNFCLPDNVYMCIQGL